MTDFLSRNWVLVLALGGMAFMHFGMHRGHGKSGHGGGCCGGRANESHEPAAPTRRESDTIPDNVRLSATDPVVEVGRDQEKEHDMSEKSAKAIDPVCHMSVDPATAAATVEHDGRAYYFCGKGCAKSFSADPGKYTNATVS
jgi:YHS domain-containing protein